MSADSDNKKQYINAELKQKLQQQLQHSITKKNNTSTAAITKNNTHYSGVIRTTTHLLDITSEHAAISIATTKKDPHVTTMITMLDDDCTEPIPDPINIKIIADHTRRTETPIKYTICNKNGEILLELNTEETYYKPPKQKLEKIQNWTYEDNQEQQKEDLNTQLFENAKKGLQTHFSSNTKTNYGAAILANGKIYRAGVYSSFDHRLNIHAEMAAAITAIAQGNKNITHIAIISTKYENEPVPMCGCCRQFFTEISPEAEIISYSMNGHKKITKLADALPDAWNP